MGGRNSRGRRFRRQAAAVAFQALALAAVAAGLGVLGALLWDVVRDGAGTLTWTFLNNFPSRRWEQAGLKAAIAGSLYLMTLVAMIAFPLGVGAAVYLEEYARRSRMTRFLEVNIANLAAVPSIVYGLLGLAVFVRAFSLGRSLLAGALTMSLLILPVIITAGREAIRSVPSSIRQGAYALGASRWQVVWHHVLPLALPGILTGAILALSRAIGETAPLIAIGALTYVAFLPESVLDPFTVMPIQIYNWVSRPQEGFHAIAASGIIVLLAIMLAFNAAAIWLRGRMQGRSLW